MNTLEQLKDGSLASGSADKTVKIWNVKTGDLLKTVKLDAKVYVLGLLSDGNLACLVKDKFVVINTNTYKIVVSVEGERFNRLVVLKDGHSVALGQTDGNISIWNASSGEQVRVLSAPSVGGEGSKWCVWSLIVFNDGNLASGCENGEIRVWRVDNGRLLKTIKAHNKMVSTMVLIKNGTYLATASAALMDFSINIWK